MYNNLPVVKKFSSPVTPILETKGHKTLLKELFMYYVREGIKKKKSTFIRKKS